MRSTERSRFGKPRIALAVVVTIVFLVASASHGQGDRDAYILLRPDRVIDGRGEVFEGVEVAIRGDRIEEILDEPRSDGRYQNAPVYDLSGTTLLPGLIDTHVHIDWTFDRSGRLSNSESEETPEQRMLSIVENAVQTLLAGVTTVQSLGSPRDADLRDWIERGIVPGPRILTSLSPLSASTGDPAALSRRVVELAESGADVIKIFASESIRVGGGPTLSQEQLDAACQTARERGLRAVVHAHGPESARRSALAGCTTIEHGALLDRETLELLAARGVYYDPNVDLVLRNYFENQERFLGIGSYTANGFAQMRAAQPKILKTFQEALTVPNLQILFGTDAVAGAHGRNVEELVYRIVIGGQDASEAIVSATSLAAESLGLGHRIGSVVPGFQADLIAVRGDPLADAEALGRVVFVMRAGKVFRFEPRPASR